MRRLTLLLAFSFAISPLALRLEAKKPAKTYYRRSHKSKTKARGTKSRAKHRSKTYSSARAN